MDIDKLNGQDRYDMLTDIANQYYNLGKTQTEIADYYDTNRFKIAKLLQEAKNEQVVEIRINYSNERTPDIERALTDAFPSLSKAIVVNTQYSPYIDSLRQIGKVGADYLNRILPADSTLGVTWGKTIYSVISQLQNMAYHPITAVQLTGALNLANPSTDSRELVRTVASVYNGFYHYIDAPLYVKDQALKELLLREPCIQNTLSKTQNLNTIITGIGGKSSLPITNPQFRSYVTETDLAYADKCSGSIFGYILDEKGKIANVDLNRKVIATPVENILKTPHRLAVVYGRHKADVTCKALRNGLFNEILTDTDTALNLLEVAK